MRYPVTSAHIRVYSATVTTAIVIQAGLIIVIVGSMLTGHPLLGGICVTISGAWGLLGTIAAKAIPEHHNTRIFWCNVGVNGLQFLCVGPMLITAAMTGSFPHVFYTFILFL